MNRTNEWVKKFFEDYEKGIGGSDIELLAGLYSDIFMFANLQGAQAVKKADFLKMLPKRGEYFKTLGLASSTLRSFEETRLDDHYSLVKVRWEMRYEREGQPPLVDENTATYILFLQENSAQIVFQLDHQDLVKKAQDQGLSPT